jgi:hypothetical protein
MLRLPLAVVMLLITTLLAFTLAAEAMAWMKSVWTPATLFWKSCTVELSVTTTVILIWYVHMKPGTQVHWSLEEEPARDNVLGGQATWVVGVGHTASAGQIGHALLAPVAMLYDPLGQAVQVV